jgi:hypothetical protein
VALPKTVSTKQQCGNVGLARRTVEDIRVGEEVGADRQRDHSEGKGHQLEDDAAGEVRNPIQKE